MSSFNEQILQSQRPNFFDLLAQESMHEALRPAFQYICKVGDGCSMSSTGVSVYCAYRFSHTLAQISLDDSGIFQTNSTWLLNHYCSCISLEDTVLLDCVCVCVPI